MESPLSQHDEIEIPLKSCGKAEGVIFELTDLNLDTKFEFRIGKISAEVNYPLIDLLNVAN